MELNLTPMTKYEWMSLDYTEKKRKFDQIETFILTRILDVYCGINRSQLVDPLVWVVIRSITKIADAIEKHAFAMRKMPLVTYEIKKAQENYMRISAEGHAISAENKILLKEAIVHLEQIYDTYIA